MVAFATAAELAARLGRGVWADGTAEFAQVQALLADATDHLRGIIGWQVSPAVTVTERFPRQTATDLRLPGAPITGVVSVTAGGAEIFARSYELIDGALHRASGWPVDVTVTYTVGYAAPPRELVSWTCVLASQALTAAVELGALGGGGVATVAIDDFRKSWHNGGEGVGFVLPPRVEDKLRERYGSPGAVVTGTR